MASDQCEGFDGYVEVCDIWGHWCASISYVYFDGDYMKYDISCESKRENRRAIPGKWHGTRVKCVSTTKSKTKKGKTKTKDQGLGWHPYSYGWRNQPRLIKMKTLQKGACKSKLIKSGGGGGGGGKYKPG